MKSSATSADRAALESAGTLALAIQTSAEWRELESARQAAKRDTGFARLVQRHSELARRQNRGGGLEGKLLAEFLALREEIQGHEMYRREQGAWSAVVELLERVNTKISEELGIDFASNAAPRSGCCS